MSCRTSSSKARWTESTFANLWPASLGGKRHPNWAIKLGCFLGRLKSLLEQWRYSSFLLQQWHEVFQDQVKLSIIGAAPHRLPHRAAVTQRKNVTKNIVVFDALIKIQGGQSFNKALHKGSILPNLVGISLQWWWKRYNVLADVIQASSQVALRKVDIEVI